MKKNISFLMVMMFLFSLIFQSTAYAEHWADENCKYLLEKIGFYKEFKNYFNENLDDEITREAFFSLCIFAVLGKQEVVNRFDVFEDFENCNENFSGYIAKAYDYGLIQGEKIGDKYYIDPRNYLTREEAATFIGSMLGISVDYNTDFLDDEKISEYAEEYVNACQKSGIINGFQDNTFRPSSNISWGECMTIISNLIKSGMNKPAEVSLIAGGAAGDGNNKNSAEAIFNGPAGIYVKDGVIYIVDSKNNVIKEIKNKKVSVFAGMTVGYDEYGAAIGGLYNSTLKKSLFKRPSGIIAKDDKFLILDSENNVIRQIYDNNVTTYSGSGTAGYLDGDKNTARFENPQGFCFDDNGNLYVADTGNNIIRMVDKNGKVSTFAGKYSTGGYIDGDAMQAQFNRPSGIAYYNNSMYVADSGNNCIREIKDGKVNTFAGINSGLADESGNPIGDFRDGKADSAYFYNPTGICIDKNGTIYIADTGNQMVRKIENGNVSTLAGFIKPVYSENKAEQLISPKGLFIDNGILYVTDSFKNTVISVEVNKD